MLVSPKIASFYTTTRWKISPKGVVKAVALSQNYIRVEKGIRLKILHICLFPGKKIIYYSIFLAFNSVSPQKQSCVDVCQTNMNLCIK